MASLDEVIVELRSAVGKADEVVAALQLAVECTTDAVELFAESANGTYGHEYECGQVVEQWTAVVDGATALAEVVAGVQGNIGDYIRLLMGDGPPLESTAAVAPSVTTTSTTPATGQSESSWIERQRDQLPTYVTSGFYRDEDGNSDLVQSGREPSGEDRAIVRHLIDRGLARPRGSATVAQHVETKVGWRMRQSGVAARRADREQQGL